MQPEQKPLRSGGNGIWRRAARSGPAPEGGEDARITIRQAVPSPRPAPGPAAECFEIIPATRPPLRQAGGSGLAILERCGPGGEAIEGQESGFAITIKKQALEEIQERELCLYELIDLFCSEHDARQSSREGYRRALRQFAKWLIDEDIRTPEEQDIIDFKRRLESDGKTAKTINTYLSSIRLLFTWANAKRFTPHNIAANVKGMKIYKREERSKICLTPRQSVLLLRTIDRSNIEGKRDFALLTLAIGTGLRAIEIVRANVKDISHPADGKGNERNTLFVHGKGRSGKNEDVILEDDVYSAINDYLGARENPAPEDPLFVSRSKRNRGERLTTRSVSRLAKELFKKFGINTKKLTLHSLRHTACTNAHLGGAPILKIADMARHSDINTTMSYSHNVDKFQDSAEGAISRLLAEEGRKLDEEIKAAAVA